MAFGDRPPDPALVARGARQVRLGVGMTLAAVAGMGVGSLLMAAHPHAREVLVNFGGGLAWQLLVGVGLLAGSKLARGLAIASGGCALFGATIMASLALRVGDTLMPSPGSLVVLIVGMALLAAGTTLATLTPAARAYHESMQGARSARRKAKSLADWRRGAGSGAGDA